MPLGLLKKYLAVRVVRFGGPSVDFVQKLQRLIIPLRRASLLLTAAAEMFVLRMNTVVLTAGVDDDPGLLTKTFRFDVFRRNARDVRSHACHQLIECDAHGFFLGR